MHRTVALRLFLAAGLALAAAACKQEGPAEKAGRKMDEALEKLRHGDEGVVERTARKLDEALEEAGDEIEDAVDDVKDDLGDAVDELRDEAADAIES
jgi:gas vesicle protein